MRVPSGPHPTLFGGALDEQLAVGQFVITMVPDDNGDLRDFVFADRNELLRVLAYPERRVHIPLLWPWFLFLVVQLASVAFTPYS